MVWMFSQRAFKGMTYLDQHKPGWVDLIDTDRLDMIHPERCVIAQVYGSYWAHCAGQGDFWNNVPSHHEVYDYGFNIDPEDHDYLTYPYKVLTEIWVALINDRKGL